RAFVVLARLDPAVGDETERAAGLQRLGAVAQRLRLEEGALRTLRFRAQLQALVQLGDQDVPAAHAHQHEDDQGAAGDEVAIGAGAGAADAASVAIGAGAAAEAACAAAVSGATARTQNANEAREA